MPAALRMQDLRFSRHGHFWQRRRTVLNDISMSVEAGEIFGFLGPNGAGKTTTIKAILGLIVPDAGRISILGGHITDPDIRRRVGFMPEQPYFPETLTARELVLQHAVLAGLPWPQAKQRTASILERVGLAEACNQPLRTYSKGMWQRAGLAQALVGDPDLIVLDEPMSGLDPLGRRDLRLLMNDLRSRGKTVFFSTHIIPDVEMICDRVAILRAGRVQTVESVDALMARLGGGDVQVAALGVSAALRHRISADGTGVAEHGQQLVFTLPSMHAANALVDTLRADGAVVTELQARRGSLEDVFVRSDQEVA